MSKHKSPLGRAVGATLPALTTTFVLSLFINTVMLVSPIVVIQSGTYLGYLFTLGLGLLFVTALCSGVRTGRRGRLVVAGLLVGWIFMTRPFLSNRRFLSSAKPKPRLQHSSCRLRSHWLKRLFPSPSRLSRLRNRL